MDHRHGDRKPLVADALPASATGHYGSRSGRVLPRGRIEMPDAFSADGLPTPVPLKLASGEQSNGRVVFGGVDEQLDDGLE